MAGYFGNETKLAILRQSSASNVITGWTTINETESGASFTNTNDFRLRFNSGLLNQDPELIIRDTITGDRGYKKDQVIRGRETVSGSLSVNFQSLNKDSVTLASSNLAFNSLLRSAMGNTNWFGNGNPKYLTMGNNSTPFGKSDATVANGVEVFSGLSLFFDLPGTGVHSGRRITGGVIPSFSFSMNSGGFSNFDFNFLANKLTFESTTISSALTADVRIQGFSSQLKIGAAQTNDFTFGNDESSINTVQYTSDATAIDSKRLYITDFSFDFNHNMVLGDNLSGEITNPPPYYSGLREVTGSFTAIWNQASQSLTESLFPGGSNPNNLTARHLIFTVKHPSSSTSDTIDFVFPHVIFTQAGITDLSPDQLTSTFNFSAYLPATDQNGEFFIQCPTGNFK